VIYGKKTRLEMDDYAMWRQMGVHIDSVGCFFAGDDPLYPNYDDDQIDLVSNTLVWMLAKIVNLIAIANDENGLVPESSSMPRVEAWQQLRRELQMWFKALPPSFQPCSQLGFTQTTDGNGCASCRLRSRSLIDHETWYSDSMCASTMQSYHMAEIFLLLHQPRTHTVPPTPRILSTGNPSQIKLHDALSDFHQLQAALQYHSVEICGIALSRPEEAARIHMLQPLYLAGRCLTDVSDRRTVVALIDSIEDELGWHAKYRVDQLLVEWSATREELECCH
jgi:hypothetical protein